MYFETQIIFPKLSLFTEGSAVLDVANRALLSKDIKAGKSAVIQCSVKLTNVKVCKVDHYIMPSYLYKFTFLQ